VRPTSLLTIRILARELRRLTAAIDRLELVYIILGLLQMERRLQAQEGREAAEKSRAVGCLGVPERRSRLEVLDVGENLRCIRLAQVHPVVRS
jgi:hypothetical protein